MSAPICCLGVLRQMLLVDVTEARASAIHAITVGAFAPAMDIVNSSVSSSI